MAIAIIITKLPKSGPQEFLAHDKKNAYLHILGWVFFSWSLFIMHSILDKLDLLGTE